MRLFAQIEATKYEILTEQAVEISIPLRFNGKQPNAYDVPAATAKPYKDGNFVGDTRQGGGCNFEEYRLIPHCNGTHTEGVGHIALERISIDKIIPNGFIPSTLITVEAQTARTISDSCQPVPDPQDQIITSQALLEALRTVDRLFLDALIIRTTPNDLSKVSRRYTASPPPYFSNEAMTEISKLGVNHLLVDLPSVDRAIDGGLLSNHHIFWNIEQGSHEVKPNDFSKKTITELIFVPDEIVDGKYFLSLSAPHFVADAAPSRPILFPAKLTDA